MTFCLSLAETVVSETFCSEDGLSSVGSARSGSTVIPESTKACKRQLVEGPHIGKMARDLFWLVLHVFLCWYISKLKYNTKHVFMCLFMLQLVYAALHVCSAMLAVKFVVLCCAPVWYVCCVEVAKLVVLYLAL